MTDDVLKRIMDDEIIDKTISKYRGGVDDELRNDLRQELLLMILEMMATEKYAECRDKFSYLCRAIQFQVNSSSSMLYYKYFHRGVRYETTIGDAIIVSKKEKSDEEIGAFDCD